MITENISMDVFAAGTEDSKNTYEIRRTLGIKGKKSLVIELYPTIPVDKCTMMDVSTMHLMNHIGDFGWNDMRIVNLYSTVISTKPHVNQLQGNSLAYIEEILEDADIKEYDIVIAWGNSLSTHKNTINAKIDLLTMLKEKGLTKNAKCISVDGLDAKTNFGVHPLYLGLHYSKYKWELIEYPVEANLKELERSVKNVPTEVKKNQKEGKKVPEKNTKAGEKE